VIGGGTAGLAAATEAARYGAKVALVEQRLLGGPSFDFSCVHSRAFLRDADGLRRLRFELARDISVERLASMGIDVYFGHARFASRRSLAVEGQALEFRRAIVATGSRPLVPSTAGLAEIGYLTRDTVFSLAAPPRALIIVGAGRTGCELAQVFRRSGSEVHLVGDEDRLLSKEDRSAADIVRSRLEDEGVHLHLGWIPQQAERLGAAKSLVVARASRQQILIGDEIFVAAGRRPAIDELDPAAAGIATSARGIVVNDYLQTSNRRIFAAGDACAPWHSVEAAEATARLAVGNALLLRRRRASRLNVPRITFTDPQVAHVGVTPEEAQRRGVAVDSHRVDMADVDRAILDGQTAGFVVVHTSHGSGRVVGGTIVAPQAGEMIAELTLALDRGLTLSDLARTIRSHGTYADAIELIAHRFRQSQHPRFAGLLERWLVRHR
jgi:pyruvate/2-oxoglutarate dehydrogenase complex dihydrolipoamide dehydrogenase (E3) component